MSDSWVHRVLHDDCWVLNTIVLKSMESSGAARNFNSSPFSSAWLFHCIQTLQWEPIRNRPMVYKRPGNKEIIDAMGLPSNKRKDSRLLHSRAHSYNVHWFLPLFITFRKVPSQKSWMIHFQTIPTNGKHSSSCPYLVCSTLTEQCNGGIRHPRFQLPNTI